MNCDIHHPARSMFNSAIQTKSMKTDILKKQGHLSRSMMALLAVLVICSVANPMVWATTYYAASGDPANVNNWGTTSGGTGTHPANFTAANTFIIENGHTMTAAGDWIVSGGATITINSGGTLDIATYNFKLGGSITINGSFKATGASAPVIIYTASGTFTPGVAGFAQVECWGGGGGGGGAVGTAGYAGGGGAGGGYVKATGVSLGAGTTYTVTVGAAGAAGTTTTPCDGGAGGSSSVSGGIINTITAMGGAGGSGATSDNNSGCGGVIGGVYHITITSGGSGYTANPSCTISGGGGTQAGGKGRQSGGAVSAVTITNQGSGYTSVPTVSINNGGGSGATATASVNLNVNAGYSSSYSYVGGNGANGVYNSASGGGGGAASRSGNGNPASGTAHGAAADSIGGNGADGSSTLGTTGATGSTPGGGGSGGYANGSGGQKNGGAGGAGQVILTWYQPPTVTVSAATAITNTAATLNGSATANGAAITEHGFYYQTSSGVTTAGTKITASGSGDGSFNASPTLSAATTYYFKAYAATPGGTTLSSSELSFTTLATEPTTQAAGVGFASVTSSTMTVNWTAGNGANSIVVVKAGSAPSSDPVDGTTYTASTTYGSGTGIGGGYVCYVGSGNTVNLTGLTSGTTYYVNVYTLNGSGGTENYLATSPATGNQTAVVVALPTIALHTGFTSSSTYGDALQFDVTVPGSSPTGTVTVKDGGASGTAIGSLTLPNGYVAGNTVTVSLSALNILSATAHNNIVAYYGGDGNNAANTSAPLATQTVGAKGLTITGATAQNKRYDGNMTANVSGTLVGVVSGDSLTLSTTGTFASPGPGTGIGVTFNVTGITANYSLTQPGVTASIFASPTWNGGSATDNNWSDAANWNGLSLLAANDQLVFDGSTRLDNTNNTAAGTTYSNITFNATAGAFVLNGNPITLAGGNVTNNSSNPQTINLGLNFSTNLTLNGGTGGLVIGGGLTNTFGVPGYTTLTLAGVGTLTNLLNSATSPGGTNLIAMNNSSANWTLVDNATSAAMTNPWAIAVNNGTFNFGTASSSPALTLTTPNGTPSDNVVGALSGASGTFNMNGGTLSTASRFNTATAANATGIINQVGGTLNINNIFQGANGSSAGEVSSVNVSGGTMNIGGAFYLANRGTGSLTVSGAGQVFCTTLDVSRGLLAGTKGTVNLNGGTLAINYVGTATANAVATNGSETATFNFNGGTLQARQNNATFITQSGFGGPAAGSNIVLNLIVKSGGAIIDTAGFDVTNTLALQHDSTLGGTADGGLTKLGAGVLALNAANTYTGNTTISAGTLIVNGSIATGVVTNYSGAILGGSGTIGGNVGFASGAMATNNQGSPLTINGTLTLNNNTIYVSTPSALGVGNYTLINYTAAGSSGSFNATPVISGAGLAANTTGTIVTSAGLVTLHVALNTQPTALAFFSSANPSTYGQSITFTAVVQTNNVTAGNATSNVVFSVDGTPVITNSVSGGQATYVTSLLAVPTHTITATFVGDANYLPSTNSLTQTVNPAPLSITANNTNKVYDGAAFSGGNGVTYSGFVNGETSSVLTGTLACGGTSQGATNAGNYAIIPSGLSSANYAISYTNGTLTINKAGTFVGASSTKNPSGYKDTVAYTASLPSYATGSVVFSSTNGPISTNTVSSGSATSLSITNLPRGTNIITVAYLGDGNYLGSTTNLNQIVTNHPPVANPVTYTRNAAINQIRIAVTNLLSNVTDVDGDTLTLASVSATTNTATLIVSGGWVMYYNTNAVNDEFSYTVSDGYGGTNSATVSITVDSTPVFGQSTLASTTGGTATLNFAGIPTYSYSVLRSTNLTGWDAIWTTNAPSNGLFQYIDPTAPQPSAYYRLQFNP
jgi:MBG domain (YGX type)/Bacterial Ig-like domain (group 3)/Cadherin-like domain/YDG domain/Passenger-associated-transport-repeat